MDVINRYRKRPKLYYFVKDDLAVIKLGTVTAEFVNQHKKKLQKHVVFESEFQQPARGEKIVCVVPTKEFYSPTGNICGYLSKEKQYLTDMITEPGFSGAIVHNTTNFVGILLGERKTKKKIIPMSRSVRTGRHKMRSNM